MGTGFQWCPLWQGLPYLGRQLRDTIGHIIKNLSLLHLQGLRQRSQLSSRTHSTPITGRPVVLHPTGYPQHVPSPPPERCRDGEGTQCCSPGVQGRVLPWGSRSPTISW